MSVFAWPGSYQCTLKDSMACKILYAYRVLLHSLHQPKWAPHISAQNRCGVVPKTAADVVLWRGYKIFVDKYYRVIEN
jgi:hypothetical protein